MSLLARLDRYRSLMWAILVLLAAGIVVWTSLADPGINGYARAMFPDMVYGKAHKPYVYRTLVPSTVRALQAVVPQKLRIDLIEAVERQEAIVSLFVHLGWETNYAIEYGIVIVVLFLSVLGFMGALQYLYEGLFDGPANYAKLIGLLAGVSLMPLLKYYNYIYDFPQLFLFTLALGLMARKNWAHHLVVFVFCCFNKETSILLVMVFFFYFLGDRELDRHIFWKFILIQMAIFMLVKGVLTFIYLDNPGSFVEFHLYDYNLIKLRKIKVVDLLLWGGGLGFLVFSNGFRNPGFCESPS